MPQSLHILPVHIVFSTKHREPLLTNEIRPRVWACMSRCLQTLQCNQITIGGVADHVHISCHFTKHEPVKKVLQVLKQDSSKFAKTLTPALASFQWQDGYGIFGVSPSHLPALRAYIENQEAHHKTELFQDEYRRLLKKYGIRIDERYLWD